MASSQYRESATQTPTLDQLQQLTEKLNLNIPQEKLHQYQDAARYLLAPIDDIINLPEEKPEVKYPRTPGYRPGPEENPLGAWYWKTDIKGQESGKLAGKKIALKDHLSLAGVPLMCGSKLLEGFIPDYDAPVVTKILDQGGHIVGKAVCENMCYSGGSFTSASGPVLHPKDNSFMVGGSSSGSALLVSTGEVDMATGGDQGGSIRIPASYLGIVGLKPTHGLVSYTGVVCWEPTLDHIGPITRNVYDCAQFLEVLAGSDGGFDPRQPAHIDVPEYTKHLGGDLSGMKIALIQEGFDVCDKDVQEVVKEAAFKYFTQLGADVEMISFPTHVLASNTGAVLDICGSSSNVIGNAGVSLGHKGFYDSRLGNHLFRSLKHCVNDAANDLKAGALTGTYIKDNYGHQFYCKASNMRRRVTREYNELLQKYDVVVMPTVPTVAQPIPKQDITVTEHLKAALDMVINVVVFDVTGHPSISINAGSSPTASNPSLRMPVGMMISAAHFQETKLLKVAHAFEQAFNKASSVGS